VSDSRARRGVTPTDRLTLGFIVVFALMLLVQAPHVPSWPWLLGGDALVGVLLLLLPRLSATGAFSEFVGGGYPVLLTTAFYTQLGVIQLDAGRLYDAVVQRWELGLFGAEVSVLWHQRVPSQALSWVLHACYGSYYWIVMLVPVWLFVRGRREAYQRAGFIMALAFYSCYLIFGLFPVAGPNYFYPLPTGPVVEVLPARYVYMMLGAGSAMGTAFPSSHVAATWCTVYAAWRDARRLALVLAPVALLLAVGTVYGQFHYAVDAIAGALLALLLMAAADPLRRLLDRPARS